MLTEEVKTLIEILYLIIGYGPLRVMREFPAKRGKTFGLDNLKTSLQRSCLKNGRPSARTEWHSGLRVSLTSAAIGGSD